VKEKLAQGDGAYDKWVEESKDRTKKRLANQGRRGGSGEDWADVYTTSVIGLWEHVVTSVCTILSDVLAYG
jgi:hypothetical protein